ncbi:MAG: ATP synthase F0 subunit B, partial [Dehalococcoidia bacterium]|nr:ATP synthase F0 subunit B [Dehalococcoidia bacterium]
VNTLSSQYYLLAKKIGHPTSPLVEHHVQLHPSESGNLEAGRHDFLMPSTNGNSNGIDNDKLENLDTLVKFAEITVIEAAKHAKSIKCDIEEKAKAEANNILARAHEQAEAQAERIIADAELKAQQRGKEILSEAQQEAKALLQTSLHGKNAVDIQGESSPRIFKAKHAVEQKTLAIIEQVKTKAEENLQIIMQESERLLSKGQKVSPQEIKESLDNIHQGLSALLEIFEAEQPLSNQEEFQLSEPIEYEISESGQNVSPDEELQEQIELNRDEKEEGDTELFYGTIELALPPPVSLDRMLQLHKHLKQTPNIDVLNLGGSVDKGITIRILTKSPVSLLKTIGELDEVNEITEELHDSQALVPGREGREENPIRRLIVTTKG